jgi:hypothetical protein
MTQATQLTILPGPSLTEAVTAGEQPAVGKVPTVQGTPLIADSTPGQNSAQSAANASPAY